MNKEEFIKFVRQQCKLNGIKCILRSTKYCADDTQPTSGYFDDGAKILRAAMGRSDGIEILAHEYCHMNQWIDQIPLWKKIDVSSIMMEKWLKGKKVSNLARHIAVVRDLEADCEKRTVNLIQELHLPVNLKRYIKKANSYIYYYNWLVHTCKWSSKDNMPYDNKRLVDAMPITMNNDYNKLPKKYEKIYREENI